MTARDFIYWLQGYFELLAAAGRRSQGDSLTEEQANCIRNHLNMVFLHDIDPKMGDKKHQEQLNELHAPGNSSPFSFPDPSTTLIRC